MTNNNLQVEFDKRLFIEVTRLISWGQINEETLCKKIMAEHNLSESTAHLLINQVKEKIAEMKADTTQYQQTIEKSSDTIAMDEEYNDTTVIGEDCTSIEKTIWDKTWRLWAAIACFAGCILSAYLIFGMFTDGKSHVFKVKGLIAPIILFFYGFYLLVEFIFHLFNIKS